MYVFRSFGVVARAWKSVLPLSIRPVLWVPFLLAAAVEFLVLGLFVAFHQPGIQWIGVPLVRALGGDTATQYPMLFVKLPLLYSRSMLVVGVCLVSLATGAATLLFARRFGLADAGSVVQQVRRRAPALVLTAAVSSLAVFGLSTLPRFVPHDLLLGSSMVRWGMRGGLLLCIILVVSLLVYATPWVILEGLHPLRALRDSVLVTARTFLPTVLLVGIPLVLLYPLNYLAQRVDLIVVKLRPEGVAGVLAAHIVLETLLSFLLVGGATRLFMWRVEAAR
jgi:hypothetical protein